MSDYDLKGKVCLVTGGASGYGHALVQRLMGHGARVVIVDLNSDVGLQTVRDLNGGSASNAKKDRAAFIQADVTSSKQMERVFERAVDTFGRIDVRLLEPYHKLLMSKEKVVVNNAGITSRVPFEEDSEHTWYDVVNVNLAAVILVTQIALRYFRKAGQEGRIVNLASMSAYIPTTLDAVYSGTKAGVVAFTEAVSDLAQASNARINAVAPHFSDTPLTRAGLDPEAFQTFAASVKLVKVEAVVDAIVQAITDDSLFGDVLMVIPRGIKKAKRMRLAPKL